jgi:hypothetical protein
MEICSGDLRSRESLRPIPNLKNNISHIFLKYRSDIERIKRQRKLDVRSKQTENS